MWIDSYTRAALGCRGLRTRAAKLVTEKVKTGTYKPSYLSISTSSGALKLGTRTASLGVLLAECSLQSERALITLKSLAWATFQTPQVPATVSLIHQSGSSYLYLKQKTIDHDY